MLLLVDVLLLALAWGIGRYLTAAGQEERRRAEEVATAKLAEVGLQANGDVLTKFVARTLGDVDVVLRNAKSVTRPGAPEPTGEACVARVAVRLDDQIVCKASEADLVMGPLPAVPRVRTGHGTFDEAYAVFVGAVGEVPAGSYRAAPGPGGASWAQPAILEGLMELDLLWMRVQDGEADLVFPPLAIEDVGRAAALAAAIEQAAIGGPTPVLARGARAPWQPWKDLKDSVNTVWVAGLLFGVAPVGLLLGFAPPLRELGATLACGVGGRLVTTSFSDGSSVSYGMQCHDAAGRSLALYWLTSGLFGLGMVVLIGCCVLLVRRWTESGPKGA